MIYFLCKPSTAVGDCTPKESMILVCPWTQSKELLCALDNEHSLVIQNRKIILRLKNKIDQNSLTTIRISREISCLIERWSQN